MTTTADWMAPLVPLTLRLYVPGAIEDVFTLRPTCEVLCPTATAEGVNTADELDGRPAIDSVTVPVKPPVGLMRMLKSADSPCLTDLVLGEGCRVNSFWPLPLPARSALAESSITSTAVDSALPAVAPRSGGLNDPRW